MPRFKEDAGIKMQCGITNVNFREQSKTFYTSQEK